MAERIGAGLQPLLRQLNSVSPLHIFYLISNFFTYRFGIMFLKFIKKIFGKTPPVKSRYAEKIVNSNFYGTISYSGETSMSFIGDYWPDLKENDNKFKRVLLIEKCKKRNWRNDPIILGTKGHTILEPGLVWVPYIPLLETQAILPISNRVQARTLAQELVSVQPLAVPTGLLNYVDFVYSESENRKLLTEKIKISKYER